MNEKMRSSVMGLILGCFTDKCRFAEKSQAVVLEVAKTIVSSDDGETYYENENVILLDIYPKANGTVSVTYGDLTKTVTDTSGAESPNAQQVSFGTFHGVSDARETPDSGILTITGDYETFAVGTYHIPKMGTSHCSCITEIIDLGAITSIPAEAFYQCDGITSAIIPYGVQSIGYQAFQGCFSLKNVAIPNSVKSIAGWAFYNCNALTSVTIPRGVESINYMTFSNCSKLASVTIPATVKKISDRSFNGCSALTNVTFDSENEYYSFTDGVLYNIDKTELCMCIAAVDSVTIPNTVTKIADYAFYTRRALKSVTIPDSVASIGVYTFAYCDELTNVTIPNAVTSIGYHTFNGCKSLTSIVIPDNVTIIESDAFTNCTGLTSITFENTSGWHVKNSETDVIVDVTDPATNVTLITDTYHTYDWYRE